MPNCSLHSNRIEKAATNKYRIKRTLSARLTDVSDDQSTALWPWSSQPFSRCSEICAPRGPMEHLYGYTRRNFTHNAISYCLLPLVLRPILSVCCPFLLSFTWKSCLGRFSLIPLLPILLPITNWVSVTFIRLRLQQLSNLFFSCNRINQKIRRALVF